MIHWSDNQQIGQMSFINDIIYAVGPCAQQAGLALANDSNIVTSRPAVAASNKGGWLITPPHIVERHGAVANSVICISTYGMIGNTLLVAGPFTIDNIYVTAASGVGPPAVFQTPCHGTQLILTKVEITGGDLIIRDSSVAGGNICIGVNSPWPQFAVNQYRIRSAESATISFIWNTASDTAGVVGKGWHCTGFHMNI